jgi:hypothetical protein
VRNGQDRFKHGLQPNRGPPGESNAERIGAEGHPTVYLPIGLQNGLQAARFTVISSSIKQKIISQLVAAKGFISVRETGLEPARPCGH